jgi:ubiquinone/menaquinone biosynthesis C-methylase UbiE
MMTKVHPRIIAAILIGLALGASPANAAPTTGRDSWQQPERVVTDLNLKAGASVADIGCGGGYFTFRLAKAVGETGKVYATEISEKALKPVADRVAKDKIANVACVLSDPTDTKLKADSLDAAFIANVLHHVPADARPALVKDIVRAIKPGGFFFLVDWRVDAKVKNDPNNRIPKEDLIKLAKGAGLELDAEFFYLTNQVFLRFIKPAAKS